MRLCRSVVSGLFAKRYSFIGISFLMWGFYTRILRHVQEAKRAADCLKLVDELWKELRTVSRLLHPPLLHEAGLSLALGWYLEGLAERSGLNVTLELDLHLLRLSPDVDGHLPDRAGGTYRHPSPRTEQERHGTDHRGCIERSSRDRGQGSRYCTVQFPRRSNLHDRRRYSGHAREGPATQWQV